MKKRRKMLSTGIMATMLAVPTMAFANETNINSSDININLEKRSVIYGDTSKISISFKEDLKANSITLNYLCYDQTLSTTLNYNPQTKSYEGTINFNIDPEYLNVWQIENIVVNSDENAQTLDKSKLKEMGLNLDDYKITQEYIVSDLPSMANYIQRTSSPVKKLVGSDNFETATKISQEGWKNGSNKLVVINGDKVADGITATPLAAVHNAPILTVGQNYIPDVIKNEIKRLNPSEIIIVGGTNTITTSVQNQLAGINNAKVSRIGGIDRHDTSLKIAQSMDNYYDVQTVYLAEGFKGDIDAVSIATKAGQDKQPVILTEKYKVPTATYNWLKNEGLKNSYFIGGPETLDTKVIDQMADITNVSSGQSVYKNRVYGADRNETNAKVIAKFYPQTNLDAMLVARSDKLTDALVAGPLGVKLGSPVLITPQTYLSKYHESNLDAKNADMVYQIGDGMRQSVIDDIAYRLSPHNAGSKTVVVDPGHGGSDPGTSNLEKNYTLDTSLSTTEYLRSKNVNVVLTRDTDKYITLAERSSISNAMGADLFVSVHFNSFNGQASGSEVYYKYKDRNGGTSKTLATNILNSILSKFDFKNRGVKTRTTNSGEDYYSVIRRTDAPAVIVESAFLDNSSDLSKLNTLEKRKTLGVQIGKGIEQTLK